VYIFFFNDNNNKKKNMHEVFTIETEPVAMHVDTPTAPFSFDALMEDLQLYSKEMPVYGNTPPQLLPKLDQLWLSIYARFWTIDHVTDQQRQVLINSFFDFLNYHQFGAVRLLWCWMTTKAKWCPTTIVHRAFNCNPLHMITPCTPRDLVSLWLQSGVDPNLVDCMGVTPLLRFVSKAYLQHFVSLPRSFNYENTDTINTAITTKLLTQAHYPNVWDITSLGNHTVINKQSPYGAKTKIFFVAETHKTVADLCRCGANTNYTLTRSSDNDHVDYTPLSMAVETCDVTTIRVLDEHKADFFQLVRKKTITAHGMLWTDMPYILLAAIKERSDLMPLMARQDYDSMLPRKQGCVHMIIHHPQPVDTKRTERLFDRLYLFSSKIDLYSFQILVRSLSLWGEPLFRMACKTHNAKWIHAMLDLRPVLARTRIISNKTPDFMASQALHTSQSVEKNYGDWIHTQTVLKTFDADFESASRDEKGEKRSTVAHFRNHVDPPHLGAGYTYIASFGPDLQHVYMENERKPVPSLAQLAFECIKK